MAKAKVIIVTIILIIIIIIMIHLALENCELILNDEYCLNEEISFFFFVKQ